MNTTRLKMLSEIIFAFVERPNAHENSNECYKKVLTEFFKYLKENSILEELSKGITSEYNRFKDNIPIESQADDSHLNTIIEANKASIKTFVNKWHPLTHNRTEHTRNLSKYFYETMIEQTGRVNYEEFKQNLDINHLLDQLNKIYKDGREQEYTLLVLIILSQIGFQIISKVINSNDEKAYINKISYYNEEVERNRNLLNSYSSSYQCVNIALIRIYCNETILQNNIKDLAKCGSDINREDILNYMIKYYIYLESQDVPGARLSSQQQMYEEYYKKNTKKTEKYEALKPLPYLVIILGIIFTSYYFWPKNYKNVPISQAQTDNSNSEESTVNPTLKQYGNRIKQKQKLLDNYIAEFTTAYNYYKDDDIINFLNDNYEYINKKLSNESINNNKNLQLTLQSYLAEKRKIFENIKIQAEFEIAAIQESIKEVKTLDNWSKISDEVNALERKINELQILIQYYDANLNELEELTKL